MDHTRRRSNASSRKKRFCNLFSNGFAALGLLLLLTLERCPSHARADVTAQAKGKKDNGVGAAPSYQQASKQSLRAKTSASTALAVFGAIFAGFAYTASYQTSLPYIVKRV